MPFRPTGSTAAEILTASGKKVRGMKQKPLAWNALVVTGVLAASLPAAVGCPSNSKTPPANSTGAPSAAQRERDQATAAATPAGSTASQSDDSGPNSHSQAPEATAAPENTNSTA